MIEVIKNGKDKKFHIDCEQCGSKISYQSEDIQELTKEVKGPLTESISLFRTKKYRYIYSVKKEYIVCPICGNGICISSIWGNEVKKEEVN